MLDISVPGKSGQMSEWGVEVMRQVYRRGWKQKDLLPLLLERGFDLNKVILSKMLYGEFKSRAAEREAINQILGIPEKQ